MNYAVLVIEITSFDDESVEVVEAHGPYGSIEMAATKQNELYRQHNHVHMVELDYTPVKLEG